MENIEYIILKGSEIPSKYIQQYIELYLSEYPKFTRELQFERFRNFLKDKNEKVILAVSDDKLIGWLMVSFAERLNKYHFNMLVQRDCQQTGIGSELLIKVKQLYDDLYGVVVPVSRYKRRDGTQYRSPLDFYKQNGFLTTGKKFVEYRDVTMVEIRWLNK